MLDPATSEPRHLDPALPPGDLGVQLRRPEGDVALLVLHGEIDALTAPQLASGLRALLAEPVDRLVIDLSGVSFLASNGLAELIRTAQVAEQRGRRLRLVVTTRAVRRPLQITGSAQLFDLFHDAGTATADPV